MKKAACVVLVLAMAIFLMNPLSVESRGGYGGSGGHWGGHGGGFWGWIPLAIAGTIVIISSIFSSPPVVAREQPPVNQPTPSVKPLSTEKIFIYPRQGQSEELQTKDRFECHSWAVSQTNFDPTLSSAGDIPEALRNQMRADYRRAEDACLDGRGYTVK
jgi:hypothetical protein